MTASSVPADRTALRRELRLRRRAFAASPEGAAAAQALGRSLVELLQQLDPDIVGMYWAMDGEFSVTDLTQADGSRPPWARALPSARKGAPPQGPSMEFRRWDGTPPTLHDDYGIPTADGAPVVPDVVLVPCVGFNPQGHRLGFGAGFYDRWLAAHPGVTAVGVAWSLSSVVFDAQPHDQRLPIIVTDTGVITP